MRLIAQTSDDKSRWSAHWIQISGASALAAAEIADQTRVPGSPSDLIFDDLDGAAHLRGFIQGYPSRAVDNYMLAVAADNMPQANTAIVMPPLIYGEGQGPGNQRSFQVPELARATLQRGRGLRVGKGQSRWGNVHIRDLGELFALLVQRAVEGGEGPGREEIWNLGGLYLASPGESVSLAGPRTTRTRKTACLLHACHHQPSCITANN